MGLFSWFHKNKEPLVAYTSGYKGIWHVESINYMYESTERAGSLRELYHQISPKEYFEILEEDNGIIQLV